MVDRHSRPTDVDKRYRLYIDESGDHVFRDTGETKHRFLCLLGCWFSNPEYFIFHNQLEKFKIDYIPHHPDEPVILHREDIVNARGVFKKLQDQKFRQDFDSSLLNLIDKANFRVVAVVIDKLALFQSYGDDAAHPYHLGLGFLLQRYAGYLNHINRVGDVLAESRGGKEDRKLGESYNFIYHRGAWRFSANSFQEALSSSQLKIKPKTANIAGLQLADILAHPVKEWILRQYGLVSSNLAPFAEQLIAIIRNKFNRHLYDERIEGYGYVLYPKLK